VTVGELKGPCKWKYRQLSECSDANFTMPAVMAQFAADITTWTFYAVQACLLQMVPNFLRQLTYLFTGNRRWYLFNTFILVCFTLHNLLVVRMCMFRERFLFTQSPKVQRELSCSDTTFLIRGLSYSDRAPCSDKAFLLFRRSSCSEMAFLFKDRSCSGRSPVQKQPSCSATLFRHNLSA